MNTILHPYEMNITYHQMHYLVVVGLLHLFDPCLHERIPFEYTWIIMNLSILGIACFSWSSNFSTKNVISTLYNQMVLYLILVMLLVMLLDCYQISHLHSWVHAENCCTCIDKIHSKTKVFIIIFLWNLYSNYYHKCRACIPNFKPIQIDLIIQLWLSSQLTQIFNKGQILSNLSYTSSNWIKVDVNLFEYSHKTYIQLYRILNVISWSYPFKLTQFWILSI